MPVAVEDLLTPEIARPARYLGTEFGSVHKPWAAAEVRWVLTYPEVYEVGASNLGHVILYNILNAQPRQLCDRAYLPAPDLAAKLRASGTALFAVEARRPLADYDILGFSLSYELGATNILEMLDLARLPLTWQERVDRPLSDCPLIFAGGQTATSNPEPYADFFDFVALGDGEELLPEIGLVVQQGKAAGLSRRDLLLDLAQIPGVYVPQFYEMVLPERGPSFVRPTRPDVPARILRRVATPIPHYAVGLVPYVETVHDRLTVEIRRGCTRGCRFCQPGMLTRPARDVEPEEVVKAVTEGMRATGFNEFSLLSLSCSDYLALPAVGIEIRNRLKDENISLSLPSQRVDRFDENIAHVLGGTRQGSLTFAPEAGTQRLRDIINKGLTNEELLRGIKTACEQGWDKIKLYFMIGLPGETDADVVGIAETVRWLQRSCIGATRRRLNFNLTISNFTPKPHTPFQWHCVSTAEFARKQDLLRDEFRGMRGVRVNFTDVRISAMEEFVGRGDRRLGPVVRRAWELGAGMDAWWESLERAFGAWQQAIAEAGLSGQYREIETGEAFQFVGAAASPGESNDPTTEPVASPLAHLITQPLPWDHLDTGIEKKWLVEDLERALAAAIVPDCSFEGCSHCGVCGFDLGHNVVVPPPPIPAFLGEGAPSQVRAQRLRLRFGKLGSLALLSHLDLMRLFDRAVRRASLPISYTGGFHPTPRLVPASALSLGTTSEGEWLDLELTEELEPESVRSRLAEQLPPELPLYAIAPVALNAPSAAQAIDRAAYEIEVVLGTAAPNPEAPDPGTVGSNPEPAWADWVAAVWAIAAIPYEKTTKSGKLKTLNLREQLYELELLEEWGQGAKLRYVGSCRNDGSQLRPEMVGLMLAHVAGNPELILTKAHRLALYVINSEMIE